MTTAIKMYSNRNTTKMKSVTMIAENTKAVHLKNVIVVPFRLLVLEPRASPLYTLQCCGSLNAI